MRLIVSLSQLAVGGTLCVLAACSMDKAFAVPCSDFAINVSSGLTPEFSWPSDCPVSSLTVTEILPNGMFADVWHISTGKPGENGISSPVRFGVRRGGSTEQAPALPLRLGGEYEVSVYGWVTSFLGPNPESMGAQRFTR
jgi:hypothetical protein